MMDINRTITIQTSAEKVYEATFTTQGIKGWWCKESNVSLGPVESVLKFHKEGSKVTMKFVITVDRDTMNCRWECTVNDNPAWVGTVLDFHVKAYGDHCVLEFNHHGWNPAYRESPAYTETVKGWGYFLQSLKNYCETGNGEPR